MTNDRLIHYILDIPEIDKEHIELVEVFDNLKNILLANEDITKEKNHLYDLVVRHFHNEELFMSKINYTFIENHKLEHKKILEAFKELLAKKLSFKFDSRYFLNSLEDYIMSHIDGQDRQISDFIKRENK